MGGRTLVRRLYAGLMTKPVAFESFTGSAPGAAWDDVTALFVAVRPESEKSAC
jgi:hypothetical protein